MRSLPSRRVLAGLTSLALGGVFVAASGFAAMADSPDPATTSVANVHVNTDGTVDVTVQGTWAWPTHKSDCNNDRYAAGWAVNWDDKNAPGNFVGTLNGVNYYVGTPTDNSVHYYSTAPRCGVYNGSYNTGSWGPETHTYQSAATLPSSICLVTYDIHNGKNGAPKDGDLVAGGSGRNGDNSVESNGQRSTCAPIIIPRTPKPDVKIVKTADKTSVQVGQALNYDLVVTNTTTSDPTDKTLTVTDSVPAGLHLDSVNAGTGWTCNTAGQTVTCTYPGVLAAGASTTAAHLHTTALAAAGQDGHVTNAAHVDNPDDTDLTNNDSSVTTPVTKLPAPDVAIRKVATPNVVVGDNITYTLSVRNAATEPTDKVVTVTDALPAGVSFVSVTPGNGWSCSGTASLSCTYSGVIAAGASAPDITVVAKSLAGAIPSVTNIANVNTPDDSNAANNQDQATTLVAAAPQPDVTIEKVATPQVNVGDSITYQLTVRNDSTVATDKTVTVTDAVPSTVTVTNVAAGNGWQCTGLQNVSCTYAGPLAAGASAPAITITGKALAGAAPSVTNVARVNNPDDGNPNNNEDHATTTVVAPQPELALTKSAVPADGSTVARGDRIDYTLSYNNTGGGDAMDAEITDVVPAHTTYVANSASCGGACTASFDAASGTVSWTLDIPAHSTGAVSFAVTVDANTADGTVITNVGHLVTGQKKVPSNVVRHEVFVPNGDLQLVKSVNPSKAKPGTQLDYTLTAKATGNITQHDVVVTDSVPDGTTYVSSSCDSPCSASFAAGVVTWTLGDLNPGDSMALKFSVTVDGPAADGTVPTSIINVGHVRSVETPREPSNRVIVPVTAVLGEKIVNPPAATALPFTGLNALQEALFAAVLIGAGMLLLTWPRLYTARRQAV